MMKPGLPILLVVAVVSGAVGYFLRGQSQPGGAAPDAARQAQVIQDAMAPAGEEKVVYTFEEESQLVDFANLWQQRQALLLRTALLEGYWDNEQATLGQINAQLNAEYSLDTDKNYILNADERTILEQAAAPAAESEEAAVPDAEVAEEAIHTFADEAAMNAFAQMWQQRQNVLLRMAVLRSYWDSEKALVEEANTKLASTYQVDVDKNYRLDSVRRALIELQTPPAPPVGAAAEGESPAQEK